MSDAVAYRVDTAEYLYALFADVGEGFPTAEIADDRRQLNALWERHHEEIARMKHIQKNNPNVQRYRMLAKQGLIFSIGARIGKNIVGYALVFVQRHLHDRDLTYAMDDLFFVDPGVRGVGLGRGLLKAVEDEARRRGARILTLRAKYGTPTAEILKHVGYEPFETVLSKEL